MGAADSERSERDLLLGEKPEYDFRVASRSNNRDNHNVFIAEIFSSLQCRHHKKQKYAYYQ